MTKSTLSSSTVGRSHVYPARAATGVDVGKAQLLFLLFVGHCWPSKSFSASFTLISPDSNFGSKASRRGGQCAGFVGVPETGDRPRDRQAMRNFSTTSWGGTIVGNALTAVEFNPGIATTRSPIAHFLHDGVGFEPEVEELPAKRGAETLSR